MNEWHGNIQKIIDITDIGIKNKNDEELTLKRLADELGYSEFYVSRKFREISGMQFRDYLRYRRLAFALTDLRDTDRGYWILRWITAFHRTKRSPVHSGRHTA